MKPLSIWFNKEGAADFWLLMDGYYYLLIFESTKIPEDEPFGFVKIGDVPE